MIDRFVQWHKDRMNCVANYFELSTYHHRVSHLQNVQYSLFFFLYLHRPFWNS